MAVSVNFQVIGMSERQASKIRGQLTQAFERVQGRWHVQFIAGRNDDSWEVRVSGPAVERSEYIDSTLAQSDPEAFVAAIRDLAR